MAQKSEVIFEPFSDSNVALVIRFIIAWPRDGFAPTNRIRWRARVVGAFPNGQLRSTSRLRPIGTSWFLNIQLKDQQIGGAITA